MESMGYPARAKRLKYYFAGAAVGLGLYGVVVLATGKQQIASAFLMAQACGGLTLHFAQRKGILPEPEYPKPVTLFPGGIPTPKTDQ